MERDIIQKYVDQSAAARRKFESANNKDKRSATEKEQRRTAAIAKIVTDLGLQ